MWARSPLQVLKNPNYRAYFIGQLISLTGNWAQSVAQSWLVYRLTQSGYWLGAVNFANNIPAFLISPWVGVLADRLDRRKILIGVQALSIVQSGLLAFLVLSGHVELWHVGVLACLLGVINAFDMTTRHTITVDLVGKEDLHHAIALNSVFTNASRVAGPALAGVLIVNFGEGGCFLLAAVSSLPVMYSLIRMRIEANKPSPTAQESMMSNILEGVLYTQRSRVIFQMLVLSAVVCLFACSINALLPIFAKKVLLGGPDTLAWLTGMMGLGAVSAALTFRRVMSRSELRRRLVAKVTLLGVSVMVLGASRSLWLSEVAMFGLGLFMMSSFLNMSNTIQSTVRDDMRGRVMSLYSMTFLGTVPLGNLILGWLSDRYGAPRVVLGSGSLTVAVGLTMALWIQRKKIRSAPAQPEPETLASVNS